MKASALKVFDLAELVETCEKRELPYLEFLRVPQLSCGIYQLAAGDEDTQSAHDEDEVYFVLSGRGRLRVEGVEHEVRAGSILYVQATSEHSFFEIEEDMQLLVFFASGGPG